MQTACFLAKLLIRAQQDKAQLNHFSVYVKNTIFVELLTIMTEYPKKLFKYDKNYILKEAQSSLKDELLLEMVKKVKTHYITYHNPLGLEDDTIIKIKSCQTYLTTDFEDFYYSIAGIYRFKYSDNQLEMIFDGKDHLQKYKEEWKLAFFRWIREFLKYNNFIKAVLEAAIFCPDQKSLGIHNRMKYFLINFFGIKVYKYKGIVELKVA